MISDYLIFVLSKTLRFIYFSLPPPGQILEIYPLYRIPETPKFPKEREKGHQKDLAIFRGDRTPTPSTKNLPRADFPHKTNSMPHVPH